MRKGASAPSGRPVRVLVVDDSPTMRALITSRLRAEPGLEVAGEAADAFEAREAVKALSPDVMTLDVEMPGMDGLDFLSRLMRLRPMPVIMVSTLTNRSAETALRALELGAVDCVGKPVAAQGGAAGSFAPMLDELTQLIRAAAASPPRAGRSETGALKPAANARPYTAADTLVCIGASTGGVEALMAMLSRWPASGPPTVIVQHIPGAFSNRLAARLDKACAASVDEARPGAPLRPGHVWLAPGSVAHTVVGRGGRTLMLEEGGAVSGHRPSADVLFKSAQRHWMGRGGIAAALMTGMGRDGGAGMAALSDAGAACWIQDEASSVVWGMPRAALDAGAAATQGTPAAIADALLEHCRSNGKAKGAAA